MTSYEVTRVDDGDLFDAALTARSLSGARTRTPESVGQSHQVSLRGEKELIGDRSLPPPDDIGGLFLATAIPSLTRPSASGLSTPVPADRLHWEMDHNQLDNPSSNNFNFDTSIDGTGVPFTSSSPTFSSSSSHTTPVSFSFSPIFPRHRFSGLEMRHKESGDLSRIPRHDSLISALSEDSLYSPSTSYAPSSPGPSSFPLQDYFGSQPELTPPKGKGKGRQIDVTPGAHELGVDEEIGARRENHGPGLRDEGRSIDIGKVDGAESLASGSGSTDSDYKLRPSRSHIGLSFLEQRYSHAARSLTQAPSARSRSRSRHIRSRSSASLQRSPTPVPTRPRSQSRIRSVREKAAPSKQSSIRRLLSIASRGRSFKRNKSERVFEKRVGSAPSLFNLFQQGIPAHSSPAVPGPSQVLSSSSYDISTRDAGSAHAGSGQSGADPSNSKDSGCISARVPTQVLSLTVDEEDAGGTKPSPTVSGSQIKVATEAVFDSLPAPNIYPIPRYGPTLSVVTSSGQPIISALTATRPPKLRFIGRSNTFTSQPFTEVSSTFASGVPVAFDNFQGNATSSAITPLTTLQRSHPSSTLISTSLPNAPGAFHYIAPLPPVTKLVPQPDGCGQILLDSIPPTFLSATSIPKAKVNHFDRILPYELRVDVFQVLVGLHVQQYDAMVQSEDWTFGVAAGTTNPSPGRRHRPESARWTGFEKGVRELVRIGRVSRFALGLIRVSQSFN